MNFARFDSAGNFRNLHADGFKTENMRLCTNAGGTACTIVLSYIKRGVVTVLTDATR
jgi:hypothetical protein